MLAVPAFRTIADATVYQDDAVWYRFYPVPNRPRVRLDDAGNPVFLLVKYALSDAEREAHPELPPGGGYLNVDVAFRLTDAQRTAIAADLQAWVDTEFARRRAGSANEQASVAGMAAPPPVEFGTPTYTGGAVALDAPQSTQLVSRRVAEGAPSLLADNVAVFSLDLTNEGATFMERTLVNGGDATDLTPIQVRYDLQFWARLPAVRIHVSADSERIYEQTRKVMDGAGVDHCTTYDFAYSDISTESAAVAGLIDVQIDTGSGSVDEPIVAELRRYALDMMQQLIESNFFTTDPALGLPPAGQDDLPLDDNPKNDKKYLRKTYDAATMKLELNLEQRSVVQWPIHPQATLETFFHGMTPAELNRFVRVVSLNDPFFQSLNLDARCFATFEAGGLEAVQVDVRYAGRDANGDRQEKLHTFTFTDNLPQTWNPALIGTERAYESRYRVKFAGRDFGGWTSWEPNDAPDLNIAVPETGRLNLEIRVGDVDFTGLVRQVQVTVAYEDPAAGIAREEKTIVLDAQHLTETYTRTLFDIVRQPVQYKRRFVLQSGDVVEDALWRTLRGPQLVVNQPAEGILNVRLLPAGDGWSDVAQVIVDLRYTDPANSFVAEESLSLKTNAEFRTWTVVLRDKTRRTFDYRINASYKDGRFEQTPFRSHTGEETLPIVVTAPPRHAITLISDRLDFAAAPLTEVTLRHAATGATETFVMRDKSPQVWRVDVAPDTPLRFSAAITHFPADGDPVTVPPFEETDPILVLPPYRAPQPGTLAVQVLPTLLDFTQTPLVTVDLEYEDDANDIRLVNSLAFGDKTPQTWTFPVADLNRKLIGYRITYFVAPDMQPHVMEMQFQEKPLLVIPRRPESGAGP